MAVLKHIASKSADYRESVRYLSYQHDVHSGKVLTDENGDPLFRDQYILEGINCTPLNFAAECRKANRQFKKNQKKGEIKTHHYIISFDPKDRELGLTLQEAQRLGMEFAKKHFPGHQMLVCAHDDGANGTGNIHVHIVLNSLRIQNTEALPYDMRPCDTKAGYKHNCTRPLLEYLQQEVMALCRDQGLHQVDLKRSKRRVTNEEYRANQRGQERAARQGTSKFETEKEKLRQAILETVQASADVAEFKRKLEEGYGITVKESRGRWSYLPPGKEKPITGRKLGDAFERAAIEKAIQGIEAITFDQVEQKLSLGELPHISGAESIESVIDLEHNRKVKSSAGYEHWAKLHNLQIQAQTFNILSDNGLLDAAKLDEALAAATSAFRSSKEGLKSTDSRLKEVNHQLRLLGQYYSTKQVYREYLSSKKKADYRSEHQAELELHDAALRELREIFGEDKLPSIQGLKEEKTQLASQRKEQLETYQTVRTQWLELTRLAQNRDSFLARRIQPDKKPTIG